MGWTALWLCVLALPLTSAIQVKAKKARQSNHVNSICSTWGREHFKTFDGDVYQFPGTCEYNLASDCHSESYQEFSVHLKRNEATEAEGNPTVKHVVVTINDLVFHLTKTQVAVNGEIVTLPYYNGGVQLERNAVYTKLYSKVGLVVMWNGEDAVMVELDTEYTNRTCGLCGDFNGLPVHNEFIHNGRKVSPIEFGNRQKVHRPNEDCEDPYEEEEEDEPADVQPKEDTCKEFHAQCDQLLRSPLWSSCGAVVNPEPYIQACIQDLCGCSNTSDSFCVCSTLAEYSRQCSHAGGQPPHWRTTAFCDKQCPFNMVYLESGSPCMDTCTHSDTSSLCEEHLMDGCFCPHGTVFDDISKRGCITQDQCQCKHDKVYNSGEVFRQDREECVCHHGQWSCKSLPSPATCAVEEGSHVTTFDGKAYTFHGDCYYPLAKVESKDEASPKFTVLVQLVPCIRQKFDTCLKSVVVLLNNDRNNALVITADGKVSHNAQITLPYNTAGISVFKPSSFHIMLQTSFGLQVQIQLVPIMQVYVTLDESYKSKTQGLCGNFNKVLSDDMKTPQGMVEGTASSFGNSWKANPTCKDREERLDDPCSLSVENENYAKHWCSMLRSSDSTFAKCHAMVDPELYYKRCTYASCNCEKSEDCLCAVFSSYVRDCATKGVVLSGWRENVCDKYTGNCPASQTYSDQLQRCQLTCSSLASKRQGCTNDFLPVDGCSCPDGLYMDDRGTCVPMDKCPCFHNGVHIKPGKSINIQEEHCVCNNGKLHCRSWKMRSESTCQSPKVFLNCSNDLGVQCSRSCRNPDFMDCFSAECESGCKCPMSLWEDGKGMCVKKHECPCSHDGFLYAPGKQIPNGCNTCTCKSGKWDCTDKKCPGTCSIYGSGHYKTFDERTYGFQGKCGYVAVQNKCGNQPGQDKFMVITENIPCGTTGTTCSKSVRVQLGRTELKLSKKTYEVVDLGVGSQIQYRVRTVGLYLIVESDIGIAVLWDRKTTVRIILEPQHSGAVCGLCGNYNGDGRDDFTTQGQLIVSSPVDFANSWKVSSTCPDAESNVDPCGARPNRHNWAKMQCSIITGKTFQSCHKKVDPTLFFENCVKDSCACDTGGDCECFCTAVAAYAQACTEAGVCVAWRTPEICPVFCDYYNDPGECEWHYSPCHTPCYKTCQNPSGTCNNPLPNLEGCYPQCPPETPIFDEETGECVEECNKTTTLPPSTTPWTPTTTTLTTEPPTTTPIQPTTTPPTTTPIPPPTTPTPQTTTTTPMPTTTTPTPPTTTTPQTTTPMPPPTTTPIPPTTTTPIPTTTTPPPTTTTPPPTTTTPIPTTTTPMPTTTTPTTTPTPTTPIPPTTTTPIPPTTTPQTTEPTTTPCIPTCEWSEWYDEDDDKDKSDWETYWNITQSGKEVCEDPQDIECVATDYPDMSLEDYVASTGQVVECDVDFGLICEENKQTQRPYKCKNYKIRVLCCVECLSTTSPKPTTTATPPPTTTPLPPTSTTSKPPTTTTLPPTTTPIPTTTTTPIPTTTTPIPTTTTTPIPTTTTPIPPTTTTPIPPTTTTPIPTTTTPIPPTTTTPIPTTTTTTPIPTTTTTPIPPTTTPIPTTTTTPIPPPTTTTPLPPTTTTPTTTPLPPTTTTPIPPTTTPIPPTTTTTTPIPPPTTTTPTTTPLPPTTTTSIPPTTTTPIPPTTTTPIPTTTTTPIPPTTTTPTPPTTTTPIPPTTTTTPKPTPPPTTTPMTTTTTPTPPSTTTPIPTTTTPIPPTTTTPIPPTTTTSIPPTTTTTTPMPTTPTPIPPTTTTTTTTTIPPTTTPTPPPPTTTTPTTTTPIPTTTPTPPPPPTTTTPVPPTTTTPITTPTTTPIPTTTPTPTPPPPPPPTTTTTTPVPPTTTTTPIPPTTTKPTTTTPIPPTTTTPITTTTPTTPTPTTTTPIPPTTTKPTTTTPIPPTTTTPIPPTTTTPKPPTTTEAITLTTTPTTTEGSTTTPRTSEESTTTPTTTEESTTTPRTTEKPTTTTPVTDTTTTKAPTTTPKPPTTTEATTPMTSISPTTHESVVTGPPITVPTPPITGSVVSSIPTTTGTPTPPPITCPEWDKVQNETFWLCNCTLARCIENNTIEIIPYECPEPEPITCTNGKKPVLQWDEFYCCQHYVCDCVCEGWGDPHYITFDGLFYSFQGNCTYVLMEEMWPRHHFKIYIDNVNCDPTEDVSCPRAIIVSYRSTVITLKNHNLIGAAQLEALIDGVSLRLPFTRHGVKVMNSGINMVLEIAQLQVVVTFGVTGFSVNLPWQHFGNNTQGHCGTCSNNQADDCMLPGGQLVENCAVMADYWPAKDLYQPDCHVPPGIPTNSPLPEPTQKPCKPDSSVCDLLKDSIFAACHPFVSPDNFFKGCVYDSCHVSNPAVECTSLQTYAAACAQFGVCIYWRNHTALCASDCPADKVYKPCGPAEQPTCDDNPDESRMNFTTEGCFCPDGMKLFNKDSGICVDKCGCIDPEGVPREFNERFEYKCQDCVCLESTKTVTCKPKVCSKPPVEICTGPGFVYVNQTDPSDPCCSSLVCRCDSSTCPPTNMNCPIGFVPVVSVPEGKCCPEHTCEPKRVCLHKGIEYLPNSKVPGSECQECTCTNKVDPKSGHYQIDCGFMQCDEDCEKGYEYQEPGYSSDDCCGKCVQTHCVLQINGTKQLLKHGDTWSAPGDKCQQYSCVKNGDSYLTQSSNIHCPPFQEANCQPGSIQTAANGCCRICVEKDKACKKGSMKSFINHMSCQSIEEVEMPYCEGSCNTFTKYSAMAASLDHSCACCQESRSSNRTVDLQCLNGDVVPYTYLHVEECSCRHSDCHKAIRVPARKTRSNTLV